MVERSTYAVASGALALIVLAGIGIRFANERIERRLTRDEAATLSDYWKPTAAHRIDWRNFDEATFAEARRFEKPVLLVLGTAWSHNGRIADQLTFADADVASFLRRSFLVSRIDADLQPYWSSAFLPLSREGLATGPVLQILFFTPSGELFEAAGLGQGIDLNPESFLKSLIAIRGRMTEPRDRPFSHETDLDLLRNPPQTQIPNIAGYLDRMKSGLRNDADLTREAQPNRAALLRLFLRTDNRALTSILAQAHLAAGTFDWLDGGFFRRGRAPNSPFVQFDKVAVQNAEMMVAMAEAGLLLEEPIYTELAKRTFDALNDDLVREGFVVTARIGDEDKRGRSQRSSFGNRELQPIFGGGILGFEETRWAIDKFGLDPRTNPPMNVLIRDAKVVQDPRFEPILARLRSEHRRTQPRRTTRPVAHVQGRVAAAMLTVARMWGDDRHRRLAGSAFQRCERFRAGADVQTLLLGDLEVEPYLGDYLAYADAALQDYLLNGTVLSLESGIRVLERALELFGTEIEGYFPDRPVNLASRRALDQAAPEVLDAYSEANTSRLIRLTQSYAWLATRSPLLGDARRLNQVSFVVANQYGYVANALVGSGASLFLASLTLLDARHVMVVGSDAVERANALSRVLPTRLVAPALGRVRPDLQSRGAGLYLVAPGGARGPFSEPELLRAWSESPVGSSE